MLTRSIRSNVSESQAFAHVVTREDVNALEVGSEVINCFGASAKVSRIFARGEDKNGRAYICFYSTDESGFTVSGSYTENELLRTYPLTAIMDSDLLRILENDMVEKGF